MAACAPGPGTLEPTPPTALTLMCNPVKPFVFAISTTALDAFIAAKGDDSYLSAFTCTPPELSATFSAPALISSIFSAFIASASSSNSDNVYPQHEGFKKH